MFARLCIKFMEFYERYCAYSSAAKTSQTYSMLNNPNGPTVLFHMPVSQRFSVCYKFFLYNTHTNTRFSIHSIDLEVTHSAKVSKFMCAFMATP